MILAEEIQTTFEIDKSSWTKVKLGDVVREVRETVKNPVAEGIERIVGLEHLEPESLHIRSWGMLSDGTTFTKAFRKGQVLFGRRRAYLKKAALATFDGICSGDITVLEAKKGLLPELLPFLIQNDKFFELAVKNSAGSLSPRAKFADFADYEFLLPPIKQQAQIAELLWDGNNVLEQELILYKKAQELIKAFVEDTIHGKCFNPHGVVQSKIGPIPKGWEVVNMEEVVTVNDGAHHTPTYTSEGIPFLRVTDIQSTEIDFNQIKYISEAEHQQLIKRCKPERGDILYSKNGTIGISKIVNWDWEFSTFVSLALLKIKDKAILDVNYLKLILDSVHIKKEIYRRSKVGTITNLHLEEIRLFRVPLPPLSSQLEIAHRVSKISSSVIDVENRVASTKALQQSLVNQIF